MSFFESALELARLGYEVFPITPRTKIPFAPLAPHGVKDATADLEIIRQWWTSHPDCNIGIRCRNVLVIDIDIKDNTSGKNDLNAMIAVHGSLPIGPVSFTGSGGWHLLFAKPDIDIIGKTKIEWQGKKTGIDIRVGDQYIVAPPSIHPNGNDYQWQVPPCQIADLPPLPAAWVEHVLPKRKQIANKPPTPPVAFSAVGAGSALSERCRAYVATMPPAVQGQGGHTALLKVANVIFHGFAHSESEGWPIMLEYNARCLPPWDMADPRDERDFRRKMNQAREKPTNDYPFGFYRDQYSPQSNDDVDVSGLLESMKATTPSFVAAEEADETIPEHLVYVPGFIEKIVQFCVEAAPRPNRMLAFCGALALMSFLITRKVQTKSGIRPNLYIIALAGSGTGKDFIRKVNHYILEMTGQNEMHGESIASGEGLEEEILAHKKMLYQTDEIQTLFAEIASGRESRYNNIVAFLLKVYTSADSSIVRRTKVGDGKRNTGPVACNQPGLILFGTSIPSLFFDALTPKLMLTGLGSRCLFIEGDARSILNTNAADFKSLPNELIETARWWTEYLPPDPGTGKVGNLAHENPSPRVVPMTDEASRILGTLGLRADKNYEKTQDPIEQVLWTRVYEIASKLALIYACSADHEKPIIDERSARWASEFTDWVIQQMIRLTKRNVADSTFAKQVLKTEEIIRKRGGFISRRDLSRTLHIRPKDLNEIIQKMIDEDVIEIGIVAGIRGKPKTVYRMTREE